MTRASPCGIINIWIEGMALDFKSEERHIMDNDLNYEKMSIPELAGALKTLKTQLEQATTVKSELQKAHDHLAIGIIPDRMDEEGICSVKVVGVGRLQTTSDIKCSILAKNKSKVREWLRSHGHGSMVSSTVNSGTLKAFVKEMMKEGKEYPVDLLNIHPYSRATIVGK